jgi:hypothetical protein
MNRPESAAGRAPGLTREAGRKLKSVVEINLIRKLASWWVADAIEPLAKI